MQTFISIFISGLLAASFPASASLTATGETSQITRGDFEALRNLEVLKQMEIAGAVVYTANAQGEMQPKCLINTAGRQELLPAFAFAAAPGSKMPSAQSKLSKLIPACSREEEAVAAQSAGVSMLEGSQVAYAHLVVACVIGAAAGVYFNSPIGAGVGGAIPGLIGGGIESGGSSLGPYFGWSAGAGLAGLVSGVAVGFLCHAASNYIIQYIVK